VVKRPWASYSPTDHAVWGQCSGARQILQGALALNFDAMTVLGMMTRRSQVRRTNEHLRATGWTPIGVGLLPS
jgi:hypothetical protein